MKTPNNENELSDEKSSDSPSCSPLDFKRMADGITDCLLERPHHKVWDRQYEDGSSDVFYKFDDISSL